MLRKSTLLMMAVTSAAGMRLESRAAQTSAICSSDFAWAQNSKQASPCQAAASVDALCNNGNWVIGALNSSFSYANPSGPVVSLCTCSWASYNLISACIACQGFPEQTPAWTVYSFGCGDLVSTTTFFPANVTLPASVAIPAWAQKNPTEWTDETFNAAQAKNISAEGIPDFVSGSTSTTHKKSNVGPIVGGVLGGLIVLVGAAVVAFWMIRRHRKVNHAAPASLPGRPDHMRNMSEMSAASMMKLPEVGGYTQMPPTPASPTVTSSVLSFNYFSRRNATSPPPVPIRQMTPAPRENVIEPYNVPPTLDNFAGDRKQANGPTQIYGDPSDPPPMRVDSTRPHTPSARVGRFNPPPYVPSSPGSSSSGQRPRHIEKQPSTDTQHSLTSSRNGGRAGDTHTHSPNASGSGMPGMITQVERANATSPAHGRTLSGASRDEKHEYTPSEVA